MDNKLLICRKGPRYVFRFVISSGLLMYEVKKNDRERSEENSFTVLFF